MAEILAYIFTSQAEIERLPGVIAMGVRMDDNDDGAPEVGVWDDIVWEATDHISLYAEKWYEPFDMANNLWVRRQASWIGAYFGSQRRGDPGLFQDRFLRITEILEKIFSGIMQIPRLPFRSDLTPAMSNLRVDDRYGHAKIRVQPAISTGGTSGRQHLERRWPGFGPY